MSASIVACPNDVWASESAPNVTTATWSDWRFRSRKPSAADAACARGRPRIDCERSIAMTIDLLWPRFSKSAPVTRSPFSQRTGLTFGRAERTTRWMTGKVDTSVPRSSNAGAARAGETAASAGAATRAASARRATLGRTILKGLSPRRRGMAPGRRSRRTSSGSSGAALLSGAARGARSCPPSPGPACARRTCPAT